MSDSQMNLDAALEQRRRMRARRRRLLYLRRALILLVAAALLVLMILTTGNKTKFLFLIGYALFVAVLVVHVSMDGFLKNRVFICMLLPLLVTDFMLLPNTTGLKRRWGIGVVMVALSAWYIL